jgi:hypothetical protein
MTEFAMILSSATGGDYVIHKLEADGTLTLKQTIDANQSIITAFGSTPDHQTQIFLASQEKISSDMRFYLSTDYGESFSLITDATLNGVLTYGTRAAGIVYDGTYFWIVTYSNEATPSVMRSSNGSTWTSIGPVVGFNHSPFLDGGCKMYYDSGYYYIAGYTTINATRKTAIYASTDVVNWAALDDTAYGAFVDQLTTDSQIFDVSGTLCIVTDSDQGGWTYTHGQSDYTLTRKGDWSSYANQWGQAAWAWKGNLYIYDDLDGVNWGIWISSDLGTSWTSVKNDPLGGVNFEEEEAEITTVASTSLNVLALGTNNHIYAAATMTGWIDVGDLSAYTPMWITATPDFAVNATLYTGWENIVGLEEV